MTTTLWKITITRFVCDRHDTCDLTRCRYVKRTVHTTTDPLDAARRLTHNPNPNSPYKLEADDE